MQMLLHRMLAIGYGLIAAAVVVIYLTAIDPKSTLEIRTKGPDVARCGQTVTGEVWVINNGASTLRGVTTTVKACGPDGCFLPVTHVENIDPGKSAHYERTVTVPKVPGEYKVTITSSVRRGPSATMVKKFQVTP